MNTLREQIFSRPNAARTEAVPMPEWGDGVTVYVHELSAADRDGFDVRQSEANKAGIGARNFRSKLVAVTTFDADGGRVFGDDDADALGTLPTREIRRLFDVASRLNGLTKEDEADLEKNS